MLSEKPQFHIFQLFCFCCKHRIKFHMNQKKNKSRSKQNRPQINQLSINLHLHGDKHLTIHVPQPCPVNTLKQCLLQALAASAGKVAYFQTINSDWLTDYKLQTGEGWLRSSLDLQCVFKTNQYQKFSGLQAYDMLKCIGVGGFSKVYLCRDKRDGQFYAAKFIQKDKVNGKLDLVINEKQVNEQVAFPFLVQMKEFFETEPFYVMILDYCPGGQLFHLQKKVIRLTEDEAKKYFIEVLLAIEYLHSKNILYRDLKPENIMIDLKGHIRIADFGLAKISKQRRFSFCGSLEYMSPQIVGRIGHSFEVDFYCLGALLYEMVVGCPPFYCYNSTQNQTKSRIMYDQVQFPQEICLSDGIKDLIQQLLVKDPNQRLGHLAGVKEIKCHSWIGWINKSDFLQKKLKMPYPVNLDSFNFDSSDITSSANRILYALNNEKLYRNQRLSANQSKPTNSKSKQKRQNSKNSLNKHIKNKNKQQKFKEYQFSLNKQKCHSNMNHSKDRNNSIKNQSFTIKTKKKHQSSVKSPKMDKFECIKNCYMGNSASLSKFLRFPTQTYDNHHQLSKQLSKERRSYVKLQTQNKENKAKDLKKRKAKDEYAFQKVKRKA